MQKTKVFHFYILLFFSVLTLKGQQRVNWISFKQLEDSLTIQPKKVLISFYADWCAYCKKMEKATYSNPKIIALLNKEYYAVKMNAETSDTIYFGDQKFINKQLGKSRNPTHEIPLLLASRKNKKFSLPATVILNKNFTVKQRYFEYISPKKMQEILTKE